MCFIGVTTQLAKKYSAFKGLTGIPIMHATEREEPEDESQNFFYTLACLGMISHSYNSYQDHSLM
jgi:hypothetical protein